MSYMVKFWPLAFLIAGSEAFRVARPSDSSAAGGSDNRTSDLKPQSCSCQAGLYGHQQWPRNQNGNQCTGGDGGGYFGINQQGRTVKDLTIWTGRRRSDGILKAIRVTYDDGTIVIQGNPSQGTGFGSFTFQA